MAKYIWMVKGFPNFKFNMDRINGLLNQVKYRQGILRGEMLSNVFADMDKDTLDVMTEEIVRSSEIEGIRLDMQQVRSSVARHMGVNFDDNISVQRDIDGVVSMTLDATHNFAKSITDERLFSWHAAMFPSGYSGLVKLKVGQYRDDAQGPMQVVSGPLGHEQIYFRAPPASEVKKMMAQLINYIDNDPADDVIKAAVAHLWFVSIHPFEDGNGRIARAISEMLLCRSEQSSQHLYTLSGTLNKKRKEYYAALEITQSQTLDITSWVEWFLGVLNLALEDARNRMNKVAIQNAFWNKHKEVNFNSRQRKVLEKLLDEFEGKLTSTKWAKICSCSHDTAGRDIADLLDKGILYRLGAGRAVEYKLQS